MSSSTPARDQARVIVLAGSARGKKFVVSDGMTIGRGRDAQIFLDSDDISRAHARITLDDGPMIEDLGSRNGTLVNDLPALGATPLHYGDRIRVGGRTILLFTHFDPAEEDLMKRQRLELLGRIAAGVAHDVNNLLGALLATQDYLLDKPSHTTLGDSETRECLLDVKAAAEQAAHLMPKLLSFARGPSGGQRVFDLSAVCSEVVHVVRRTFDRRIRVNASVEPGLCVRGDHVEIQQVVMNLCLNARDAMAAGGELTVRATAVPNSPDPCVEISVADTGTGMDEATCAHIFEPFFTTKSHGQGSGLGLANARETIAVHGGEINVESELDKGTVFSVVLPVAGTSRGDGATRTVIPPGALDESPAHLLLVDDDALCRKAFSRLLVGAGHRVSVAADGVEAAHVLEAMPCSPDVVLLDIDMPERSGEETLRGLRDLDPHLRVLIVTGNRDADRHQAMREGGAIDIIAKPFTRDELTAAIQKALATDPDAGPMTEKTQVLSRTALERRASGS